MSHRSASLSSARDQSSASSTALSSSCSMLHYTQPTPCLEA